MRKIISMFLIGTALVFNSCKKESSQFQTSNEYSSGKEFASKVDLWLENQKVPSKPNKAANIEILKNNLDFSKSWLEKSSDGEQLLIVPIGENFKTSKMVDEKSIANLVLIIDKERSVRKGNLVLYTPKGRSVKTVPRNTFYAIYNTAEPDASGEFKFHSVTGRWLYQLNYDNKRLSSVGHVTSKNNSPTGPNSPVAPCENLYLVITYYDEDGIVTGQTVTYLGPTCQPCDDGTTGSTCPDDEGSGGSTPVNVYEYEIAKTVTWIVGSDPNNPSSSQKITSTERLRGKRVATEPGGGHFTPPSNWSNSCNFCGYNDSWNPLHTYTNPTPQTQRVDVYGTLFYNASQQTVSNNKSWTFSLLFSPNPE